MKSKILFLLIFVIIAIVFSVLAFYFADDVTPAWIASYAFIILDVVLIVVSSLLRDPKYSYLNNVSNMALALGVAVSVILNLGFMFLIRAGVSAVIIANIVVIGLASVLFLYPDMHNAAAIEREKEIKKNYNFILEDRDKVRDAMNLVTDFYLKKEVEHAYDAISNAVIDGVEDTSVIEADVNRNCDLLISACSKGDVADIKRLSAQIVADIKRRETLLKSKVR